MKKHSLLGCMTATVMAFTTLFGGIVCAEESSSDYLKGDVNGDGYIGTEDAFYSLLEAFKFAIWEDAILPSVVQYNKYALDFDGDGILTMQDGYKLMKVVAGEGEWANGYRKITSSDKSGVTYRYDGEFIVASVNMRTWSDTAIVYDKTKVEYVGKDENLIKDEKGEEVFSVMNAVSDNEQHGFVDVVSVCFEACNEPENIQLGTVDLKFVVKKDTKEVTFGSCTGAGYIKDNLAEGESFADSAKKYEKALYTEETIKITPVSSGNEQQGVAGSKKAPASLSDAQQVLKIALKIDNEGDGKLLTDMNGDGQVTLEDAKLALQVALKIITVDEIK